MLVLSQNSLSLSFCALTAPSKLFFDSSNNRRTGGSYGAKSLFVESNCDVSVKGSVVS